MGKMEHVSALLLSTFALLYVVAADLPKTSFQTPIDWVILLTMLVLAATGAISVFCAYLAGATSHVSEEGDANDIATGNAVSAIGITALTVLYFLTVMGLSLPNYLRLRGAVARLRAQSDD